MQFVVVLVALAVVAAAFAVVERLWPSIRGQKRFRRGWRTDIAWLAWQPTAGKVLSAVVVFASVLTVGAVLMSPIPTDELRGLSPRENWISSQPLLFQLAGVLLLGDFIGYWQHRAFHTVSTLWRFHSIHHSSTEVDWLSSVRVHPINDVASNVASALPILFLGFSPGAFAAYVPVLTLYAIMLHANVSWTFGPLRKVIASPTYHRWHHTSEQQGLNKNFAGLFPWIDGIFGTLYLPYRVQPKEFGVAGETIPDGFIGQMRYPFRRRGRKRAEQRIAGEPLTTA